MTDSDSSFEKDFASTATLQLTQLDRLDPFYTPLEQRFERITRLARRALSVPVAAITIIQDGRQWFKSVTNWSVTELPLSESLCAEVIRNGKPALIADTLDDLYLMSNPYVCHGPKFRFYAGFPIKDADGAVVGTFCTMDVKTHDVDEQFESAFLDLGEMAQRELFSNELRTAHAELVSKLGESRRQAMFDPLTRLWNRRGGMHLLRTAFEEIEEHDHTLGLVFIDVDDFKVINDRFGHPVGDQVLRKIASTFVSAVRPNDVVSRVGGDEFLVLVRDVDARACFTIANRIAAAVRETPARTRQATVPLSVSIGIAMRDHGDDMTMETLLERADHALLRSKAQGKDRISFDTADHE
jgi:diguanylate cyclase (GGDEF)-like protein